MERFDPSAPCEKCGGTDIHVLWSGAIPAGSTNMVGLPVAERSERMDCACRRCGYTWQRRPLDAEEATA